jgi:hypothetical protein
MITPRIASSLIERLSREKGGGENFNRLLKRSVQQGRSE